MPLEPKPHIPKGDDVLNIIYKQLIDPCDAPITVWIEKMWKPLWQLVLQWYAFDIVNMYVAYLRPAMRVEGGRGLRHVRRGPKGKKGFKRNPFGAVIDFDPGEFLGQQLKGESEHLPVKLYPGEVFFWVVEGVIEKALYYWMVYELLSEFALNWTSAVNQTRYCRARGDAVLLATFGFFTQTGIFGWAGVLYNNTQKQRNLTFWNDAGVSEMVNPGAIMASCAARCLEGVVPEPFCGIRLRCLGGPNEGQEISLIVPGNTGDLIPLSVSSKIDPGDLWISEVICSGIWRFEDGKYFLHAPAVPFL